MKTLRIISILILFSLLGVSCRNDDREVRMTEEMRSVNKLQLSRLTISKLSTVADLRLEEAENLRQAIAALGDAVKLGDRVAAYSYDTYMTAYIDLSELAPSDISINDKAKAVSITLPPIRTEFAGRDAGIREVHYRVTGLRSHISPRERAAIKEQMNSALKKEVEDNDAFRDRLMSSARSKATMFFSALLAKELEGYTVDVKFRN